MLYSTHLYFATLAIEAVVSLILLRLQSRVSLPSRERVLKPHQRVGINQHDCVAPFTGACVETKRRLKPYLMSQVAPFAGACVETPA